MDNILSSIIGALLARAMTIVLVFAVTFCDMDNGKDLHDIVLTKIDSVN